MCKRIPLLLAVTMLAAALAAPASVAGQDAQHPDLALFFQSISADKDTSEQALAAIEPLWRDGYAVMFVEMARFLPSGKRDQSPTLGAGQGAMASDFDPESGDGDIGRADPLRGGSRFESRRDPRVQTRERVLSFIGRMTGQDLGDDFTAWRRWILDQPYDPHPQYAVFKANLYGNIDPRFRNFFQQPAQVRLDAVDWGGVPVSGIPALDHPENVPAAQADYLADGDIVFGFYLNGKPRAYPKRILAWHELAWDNVGGVEVTIVYCTLCGTVIPYRSTAGGRPVKFDTSGMLYESNKLLYDELTWTLWSSLTGEPLIGRMVGSGVRLEHLPVVTTTWGEWKTMHPNTTVLSLNTGFERDYSAGAAYKDYFATDELMFQVSRRDDRLDNKAEVLAIRLPGAEGEDDTVAIAAEHLLRNRVLHAEVAGRQLVVVTTEAGANRVYDSGEVRFTGLGPEGQLQDADSGLWQVTENGLIAADGSAMLPRVPAFRAFWFGWYAQYPATRLIDG